jgi:drug/metabolite transporter (DMT)-like permease
MMKGSQGLMKNNLNKSTKKALAAALLAALLYGISSPVSKILLNEIPPVFLAALLYLGAGVGMGLISLFKDRKNTLNDNNPPSRKDIKFIIAMIVLDIAAPILLLIGLNLTNAGNAALLNNFEIVATSLIALMFFRESIGRRLWIAIGLITAASMILSINDFSEFSFSIGSLLVLAATVSWGLENNCTRMLSHRNPRHVVVIKGIGSGAGSLIIAFALSEYSMNILYILAALLLGFVAYGLSIYFYITAQRTLGAARTSTFYAAAPFIGAFASWLILSEKLTVAYVAALVIMLAGTYLAATERHSHHHKHEEIVHEHVHGHDDGHHDHIHDNGDEIHSHSHGHKKISHNHGHTPDIHHMHSHKEN